ncbi:MAG TPA: DUF5668 domain-containing protein [Acidimicrobiia bacterium]|jgi:hypothetical protein|nr:DUF5668 domain-containing protein [Acidimicrobiia bacterium]
MNWGRLFLGLVVIAVGTVLLLDNLDVLNAGEVIGTWWPLLVILAGVLTFASNPRHWPFALLLTAVGVAMLLTTMDVLDLSDLIWPMVLIVVGIIILAGRGFGGKTVESGDEVNIFHVFSGSETASRSKAFRGGSISVLFGGAELDLTEAVPAPGAMLDVFAAFGGVEIKVPPGWNVNIKGLPIFGGFDNATTKDSLPEGAPTLIVNATALFGGVEVTH